VVDKEPVSLDSMDVVVDNVDVLLLDIVVAGVSVDGNRVALSLPRNRHKRSEKTSPSSATSSWISSSSSVTQNFTSYNKVVKCLSSSLMCIKQHSTHKYRMNV